MINDLNTMMLREEAKPRSRAVFAMLAMLYELFIMELRRREC